jgi:hypothetical protein
MGESTARNGRWKRGEQYGRDGTASTPAVQPRVTVDDRVYLGWLPGKVCGEHGRIVIVRSGLQ